jgi:hypothetical protein
MGIKGNIIVGIFLLHPHIFRKYKTPIPSATPRHQKSISNPAAFDVASTRRLSLIPTPELLKNSKYKRRYAFRVTEQQRRRGIFASKQHWELKKKPPQIEMPSKTVPLKNASQKQCGYFNFCLADHRTPYSGFRAMFTAGGGPSLSR